MINFCSSLFLSVGPLHFHSTRRDSLANDPKTIDARTVTCVDIDVADTHTSGLRRLSASRVPYAFWQTEQPTF